MSRPLPELALLLLLLAGGAFAQPGGGGLRAITPRPTPAPATYMLAGTHPINPHLERELGRFHDIIAIGLDTDRLRKAQIGADQYIRAVLELASAVRDGSLPGGVLHVDTLVGDTMPTAVGYRITDPERHPAEWDTMYEVGDLSAMVLAVPLALHELQEGKLHLDCKVSSYRADLLGAPVGDVTVEQLLRHTSGLPVALPGAEECDSTDSLMLNLRMLKPEHPGRRVVRSPLNFLVLGLVLESIEGKSCFEAAERLFLARDGMVNTSLGIPAGLRRQVAPGAYSPRLGHLAWGEPSDPLSLARGRAAVTGGLVTTVDDLASFSRHLLRATAALEKDFLTTATLAASLVPTDAQDGEHQGLGWALGGLGEGSFGWDSSSGCSLWIQPRCLSYAVFLTNADHPHPRGSGRHDPRGDIFQAVRKSLPAPFRLPSTEADGAVDTPPTPGNDTGVPL